MKQVLKKISWSWKKFWGYRYRVIKDDKVIQELLIYHRKIYILKNKEESRCQIG